MERKKYLVAVAAGHGTRMGADLPKQFIDLSGKAILHRTILRFIEAVPGIKVITVLPPDGDYISWWKNYCRERNFVCPQEIVRGGITRFHSVKSALSRVPDGALVAIHDGVRPLASKALIRTMFDAFDSDGELRALVPVTPMVDTLKLIEKTRGADGSVRLVSACGEVPDRERIFGAQTPQIFRSEDIKAAYAQAYRASFTDDASVAAGYNMPLTYCAGERLNFKITSPEDLVLAEAVLRIGGK